MFSGLCWGLGVAASEVALSRHLDKEWAAGMGCRRAPLASHGQVVQPH